MRNFILGTDWWTDCDDAVALRLLARAHRAGEIRLLGVGINACMEHPAASLGAFLRLEGVEGIPVGLDLQATDFGGRLTYQAGLAQHSAPYAGNAAAEDPVRLYRRLLSCSAEPVEIIEIGFLQVMAAVLESGPDDLSPLNGVELVRDKVAKLWVMAGKWDEDGGQENNFNRNARSRVGANRFCALCPVPVTFLGWEIGADVITGGALDHDDFLWHVLRDHGSANGRMSWDPMTVMLALAGGEHAAGYDFVQGWASVDSATGANHFVADANGLHRYVIKNRPNDYYIDQIHSRIL